MGNFDWQRFGAGLRDMGSVMRGQQADQLTNLAEQRFKQQQLAVKQKVAEQKAKEDLQRFIIKQNLQPFDPESMTPNQEQRVYGLGGKQYLKRPNPLNKKRISQQIDWNDFRQTIAKSTKQIDWTDPDKVKGAYRKALFEYGKNPQAKRILDSIFFPEKSTSGITVNMGGGEFNPDRY